MNENAAVSQPTYADHQNDIMDELVRLKGENAELKALVKASQDLIAAAADVLGDQGSALAADNKIIDEQRTAITTAHSALLAGDVDYAIEILAGGPGSRS